MKRNILTLLIVVLLVMMPSLAISQKKYVIQSDTVIVYTPDENRAIALLLIEGEKYEELYFEAEEIIALQDSVISVNNREIRFLANHIEVTTKLLEDVNNDFELTKKELRKAKKAEKRNAGIAGGLGVLGLILIIIICL